jgi:hypothetical protein
VSGADSALQRRNSDRLAIGKKGPAGKERMEAGVMGFQS